MESNYIKTADPKSPYREKILYKSPIISNEYPVEKVEGLIWMDTSLDEYFTYKICIYDQWFDLIDFNYLDSLYVTRLGHTSGDILYANEYGKLSNLSIGPEGYYLKVVDGIPQWSEVSTGITYTAGNGLLLVDNSQFQADYSDDTSDIQMNGETSLGTLTTLARTDHVHPSDTSKLNANLLSGGLTNQILTKSSDNNYEFTWANLDIPIKNKTEFEMSDWELNSDTGLYEINVLASSHKCGKECIIEVQQKYTESPLSFKVVYVVDTIQDGVTGDIKVISTLAFDGRIFIIGMT